MYPEDRVLVAYLPDPADFEIVKSEGWYRIPEKHAPKGLHAEYYAFYFGRNFSESKWAIHYYARQLGYELMTRRDLLPGEPDHPRVDERYYKVSLDSLVQLEEPIISLRWRRITFMHTTWDRFVDAREINDLFVVGDEYVDRLYSTLKDRGLQLEFDFNLREPGPGYEVEIAVPGRCDVITLNLPMENQEVLSVEDMADKIENEIRRSAQT